MNSVNQTRNKLSLELNTKTMVRSIIFLLTFFISGLIQAQDLDLKALDKYLSQVHNDWNIPSMTVGIVQDGAVIYSKGYGVKEVGKKAKPDGNTLYAIASNSKAFTSATLAQLVQEGKLTWETKVKDVIPYFEVYDPYVSTQVTIRDLLSHRVGLGTFSGDIMWYNVNLTSEEIIKRIKYVDKAFDFRAGYGYSNLMYITAGEIIKTLTGKSYGQNVKERFLEPLGMDRTIYKIADLDKVGNYATPHRMVDDKNVPMPWANWEEIASTGGLFSSVTDMAKWMIFNMNHGIIGTDTLLTAHSRNLMWTPHNNFVVNHTRDNDFNRNFSAYGLGWGLSDYQGTLRVGHTGGYDGFLTAFNMLPDKKSGVIVFTNGHETPMMAVTYYILDLLAGIEKPKDYSAEGLERLDRRKANDTRIADIKSARLMGTKPILSRDAITGTYKSDLYGAVYIKDKNGNLEMHFEHTPYLSATLKHWHYDTYKIEWHHPHAWFSFGTLKFKSDNNMKVTGLSFDVPNDDFFFNELAPYKIDD